MASTKKKSTTTQKVPTKAPKKRVAVAKGAQEKIMAKTTQVFASRRVWPD